MYPFIILSFYISIIPVYVFLVDPFVFEIIEFVLDNSIISGLFEGSEIGSLLY